MKTLAIALLLSLTIPSVPSKPKPEPAGLCCLCECHSQDESKCSEMCLRLQHGKKIVEENEIKMCTEECLKHGVKQIYLAGE